MRSLSRESLKECETRFGIEVEVSGMMERNGKNEVLVVHDMQIRVCFGFGRTRATRAEGMKREKGKGIQFQAFTANHLT